MFLKYLEIRDISFLSVSEDASRISRRRETHKKVKGMSKKAVQALLSAPDLSTKAGRRDLALIVIMYGTASRMDEILSMKIGHLHLDTAIPNVSIIGKGSKIRTLYLLPKAVAHLRKYLNDKLHSFFSDKYPVIFDFRQHDISGCQEISFIT